jgi:hypothetical protein
MEELLRQHRDEALRLLEEDRSATRSGIDWLVKERLAAVIAAAVESPSPGARAEAVYAELMELSSRIFALGYSMARADE